MIRLWKWILRPIVVAVTGAGGAKACEESPIAGAIFVIISIIGIVWLIKDIAKSLS